MDKNKRLLNTTQKKPASNSNLSNINITPNNNTPKNVNHRSKSNLTLKDSDAVRRIKSKYNTAEINNINFEYLVLLQGLKLVTGFYQKPLIP